MEISTAEVESVVNIFYASNNATERSRAHTWLLQLQSSAVAWEICWILMEPSKSIEVQYFGSGIIASKIQKSFYDIPSESVAHLKNKLFECIKNLKNNNLVVGKLLSALSCVILHELSSKDSQTVESYVEIAKREFSIEPGCDGLVIKLIKSLPESFNSISLAGGLKSNIRCKLGEYYSILVEIVNQGITSNQNIETTELILKCYLSWVEFGLPLSESCKLLDPLFSLLCNIHLSEYAVSVLIELITHPSSDRAQNSVLLFFSYLSKLEHLLKQSLENEDHDLANHICKLLVNSGESHIRLMLTANPNNQNDMLKTVSSILQCTAVKGNYPVDETISELTFNFWFLLQDDLISLDRNEIVETYIQTIKNAYYHLLTILLHKVEYPNEEKLSSFTEDEKEQLRCYRQDIQDTVMYVGCLLRDQCLKYFVEILEQFIQEGNTTWQKYEAVLYLLQGIAEYVELTEDVYIPKVMGLLFNLPSHQKITERAVYLIGSYSEWLMNNTSYSETVIPILLTGIQNSKNCLSCSIALKDVCCECASTFNKMLSIKIIDTCMVALSQPSIKEKTKLRLFEIIGYTMSPLDLELVKERLPSVALPVLQGLSSSLEVNNINDQSKNQIVFCLNCLHGFLRTFDSIIEPLSVQHPLLELIQMFFDIISKPNQWTSNLEIVDRISQVIVKSIDVLQEQFINLVSNCTTIILQLFKLSNCPALFTPCATLIGMFGKQDTVVSFIQEFFLGLLTLSVTTLQNGSYGDNIDFLESFMNFSARILKTSRDYFALYPDALMTLSAQGVTLLHSPETPTVKAICNMMLALINASNSNEVFKSILEANGLMLIEKVILAISGKSPRQLLDQFGDILFALNQNFGLSLSSWLNTLVSNDLFLKGIASQKQKYHFQQAVIRNKSNKRRLRDIVKEFALQCRGIQGTEYANANGFVY